MRLFSGIFVGLGVAIVTAFPGLAGAGIFTDYLSRCWEEIEVTRGTRVFMGTVPQSVP